jgi:O-antigen/teichoic acid export membrane protein
MSIKNQAVKSAKWTLAASVVTSLVSFVQLAVLARLLTPDDFGVLAMATIAIGFAQMFGDFGFSNAIIYYREVSEKQLSSCFWLNIFLGFSLFLLLFFISPFISIFYNEPELIAVLPWVAANLFIASLGHLHQSLMQKEMKFKPLSVIEIISSMIGLVVSVSLAVSGQGIFSLIYGQLSTSLVKSLLLFFSGGKCWQPSFFFSFVEIKPMISFSAYQVAERTVNYFGARLDQLIIGIVAGSHVLGMYSLAYNLVMLPISKINPVLMKVAFPLFSKVQDDNQAIKRGYFYILKLVSMINFPILLGMLVVASSLVPYIFGDKWTDAVVFVQLLSIVALLRSVGNTVGAILLAKGRANLAFKWNVSKLLIQIPGIYVGGVIGGGLGIAVAVLVMQLAFSLLNYSLLVRKLLGPCLEDYVGALCLGFIPSMLMALFVFSVSLCIPLYVSKGGLFLTIQIVTGVVFYAVILARFHRKFLDETWQLLSKK